ncbi:unnamed protein product [Medioppia subpectinata]|uniref:Uncharacterized protein n=1 Tax=Medioppia subpectinata TaxID=1979941 RepID=A0A7R9PVM5_9ACAR|nr:unnamed protein product [Medioppia subpectinata]CAG2102432.1 unnamed protein product [Medioppia subpectinata]
MITKNKQNNTESIVLCDFEYSCYTYRGFDLGTIFAEWGRGLNDFAKQHDFPEDSVVETLIQHYIDESVAIFGPKYAENKMNSTQQLVKEVKQFTLAAYLFMIMLIIQDHEGEDGLPMDKKLMIGFAEICFKNYMHLKNQFLAQQAF